MAAYGKRRYFMHLCRKGTPDRYAILKDGSMLWLEIKPPGGTVEPEQLAFHNMIQSLPNHQHLFVRSVEDVRKIFGHQSVGCV